jgi:holo-[acyl-carrier protein] synthase
MLHNRLKSFFSHVFSSIFIGRIILIKCSNSEGLIVGIGTDIIEVDRIEKKLTKEKGLKFTLFTPEEITYCESKRFSYQHFAARFAAKEAFFKALGTGWRFGMRYQEIEIVNDELGNPEIKISGRVQEEISKRGIDKVHVSLSHLKSIANAFVVLEGSD